MTVCSESLDERVLQRSKGGIEKKTEMFLSDAEIELFDNVAFTADRVLTEIGISR